MTAIENPTVSENLPAPKPKRAIGTAILAILSLIIALGACVAVYDLFQTVHAFEKNIRASIATRDAAVEKQLQHSTAAALAGTNEIFLKLSGVSAAIAELSSLPTITTVKNAAENNNQASTWKERFSHELSGLKSIFIIRHLDQTGVPFVSPDAASMIKQNMLMQINMAQWALLNHDVVVYQSSLKMVSQWLAQYFALFDQMKPILQTLTDLQKINIDSPISPLQPQLLPQKVTVPDATIAPQSPPAASSPKKSRKAPAESVGVET